MRGYAYAAIVTQANIWFCKVCKRPHRILYIDDIKNKHYCELCVPDEIKKHAIKINENGEKI